MIKTTSFEVVFHYLQYGEIETIFLNTIYKNISLLYNYNRKELANSSQQLKMVAFISPNIYEYYEEAQEE